jgi:SAM-dependent methyltransferase
METNNSSYDGLFEQVRFCPLCNAPAENSVKLYEIKQLKWNIDMLQCDNCGLTYKRHFPTSKYFNQIYSQSYNHYSIQNIEEEIALLQHRLKRIGKANGRLLDYGCGNGSFVLAALKNGWDAYGCDPYLPDVLPSEVSERCFRTDIAETIPTGIGRFACITMWATAEHLVDSRNTFLNLFSLLENGGLFIFNSPFGNSVFATKNGTDWHMSNIIEHLQFHTYHSVNYLSKVSDITIKSIRVCGSPYPLGRKRGVESSVSDEAHSIPPVSSGNTSNNGFANKLKNYLFEDIISKNKFRSKDVFLHLIHLLKNGDHLEVVLQKK